MNRIAAAALVSLTLFALPAYAEDDAAVSTGSVRVSQALSRPKVLPALYAGYAALQIFDVYSTKQALAHGATEANPLMQGVADRTGGMTALKVGVTVATIVAAERLWKTNKAAAIAVMIASNSVAAVVAARNARTLRHVR